MCVLQPPVVWAWLKVQYGEMGHFLRSTPLFVRLALIMHVKGLQWTECRTGEQDATQTLLSLSFSLSLSLSCPCIHEHIHKHREKYDHNLQRLHIDRISVGESLNYGHWAVHPSPSLHHHWKGCAAGGNRDWWAATSSSYKTNSLEIDVYLGVILVICSFTLFLLPPYPLYYLSPLYY